MFLINAVYFKGIWTHPFRKELTTDRTFHLLHGTTVEVPMMQQTKSFQYFETETFQAIRLPYGKGSFSMLLVLPADDYGLERFVAEVRPENWAEWKSRFSARDVNIVMPRFKMEYDRRFNDPLIALGMKSVFDPRRADLTGLYEPSNAGDVNLFVSFVKQKTFLEVNEEGTEAAAVTGIGIVATSMPPPPVEMKVDRPFVCFIVDGKSGLILFMGAIVDPS
jgi:serpin B